jgi:GT2 family glycosyltransferase
MKDKVSVIIVNYNMPERADSLFEAANASGFSHDVILVDNGSDLVPASKNTTLYLPENVQTTRGWLAGLQIARERKESLAYMFCITSAEFMEGDPIAECANILLTKPNAVAVHPALTLDSTTWWPHLITRSLDAKERRTFMIDNITSMYRADWFDKHNRFDPVLTYAHGIDIDTCLAAREQGKELWITERALVRKINNIGYTMDRMNMTAEERSHNAWEQMKSVMQPKYGDDWWSYLQRAYVTDNER